MQPTGKELGHERERIRSFNNIDDDNSIEKITDNNDGGGKVS